MTRIRASGSRTSRPGRPLALMLAPAVVSHTAWSPNFLGGSQVADPRTTNVGRSSSSSDPFGHARTPGDTGHRHRAGC